MHFDPIENQCRFAKLYQQDLLNQYLLKMGGADMGVVYSRGCINLVLVKSSSLGSLVRQV